jgi:hypothetical protein
MNGMNLNENIFVDGDSCLTLFSEQPYRSCAKVHEEVDDEGFKTCKEYKRG